MERALDATVPQHYVYIYSDERERVRYVGYGCETARATPHLAGSHNDKLNRFLAGRKYRLEIAGPFDSEETGRAVETALISALKPDLNVDPGQSRWRFRPVGVPLAYADRPTEPELTLSDFLALQGAKPTSVLFVIITRLDFEGDRAGYDPAGPLSDDQLRQRLDHWWQVQRFLPEWAANPVESPGLLIGVYGSPGQQLVIGSAHIDRASWASAEQQGGLIRIPLIEPTNLDAFSLRGRRIARASGLRFGSFKAQQFIRLRLDKTMHGGQVGRFDAEP